MGLKNLKISYRVKDIEGKIKTHVTKRNID